MAPRSPGTQMHLKPQRRENIKEYQTHAPLWGCKKWAAFVAERNEIGCQQELCGWKMPQKS